MFDLFRLFLSNTVQRWTEYRTEHATLYVKLAKINPLPTEESY